MSIEMKMVETDTRTAQVPVPATQVQTEQLGKWLEHAGRDGYRLISAFDITDGDQRIPYIIGLKLTVERATL